MTTHGAPPCGRAPLHMVHARPSTPRLRTGRRATEALFWVLKKERSGCVANSNRSVDTHLSHIKLQATRRISMIITLAQTTGTNS